MAIQKYVKAIDLGNVESINTMGYNYEVGNGVDRDDDKMFVHYLQAANEKHPTACYSLARCYQVLAWEQTKIL